MTDETNNILHERLSAALGSHISDADIVKVICDVINAGGGVTIELDDGRFKLIRRDGRFVLKRDEPRARVSSMPPRQVRKHIP